MFKPHTNVINAPLEIQEELVKIRHQRAFIPSRYLEIKARLINQYFNQNNLSHVVIGISGGIDSVTCLYLLRYAQSLPGSPIKDIVAVGFVVTDHVYGTTGNSNIKNILNEMDIKIVNINNTVGSIINTISSITNNPPTIWSSGQTTAHMRTTILAGIVSNLSGQDKPAIMVGTTNKDEYSYIGYFGKYSDGLNDLQIISDLHKSEVYKLAEILNVPRSVIDRIPTGDMYVECSDEQVFGVDYDCIEYYTSSTFKVVCDNWNEIYQRIHHLNKINKHKYLVGIPSRCIDILESGCERGRELNLQDRYQLYLYNRGNFIARQFVNGIIATDINQINIYGCERNCQVIYQTSIFTMEKAVTQLFLNTITDIFNKHVDSFQYHAGKNGYITYDKQLTQSRRVSLYDYSIANSLWNLISTKIDKWDLITGDDNHFLYPLVGNDTWIPIGINPLLRIIEYKGGKLVPHYDYTFSDKNYDRENKTLMSVVIYIDCHEEDGTVFYQDPQEHVAWCDRDKSDLPDETGLIQLFKKGITGDVVIFPHHLLHGSLPTKDNRRKLIIRTDIMFEKVL